jgi:hypothetical protein
LLIIKKIPFEAVCSIRAGDGDNFFISSIEGKKNKDDYFYEEINTTNTKFKFETLRAFKVYQS